MRVLILTKSVICSILFRNKKLLISVSQLRLDKNRNSIKSKYSKEMFKNIKDQNNLRMKEKTAQLGIKLVFL